MLSTSDLTYVTQTLSGAIGSTFKITSCIPVYGGNINQCFKVSCFNTDYFLKTNKPQNTLLFQTEYQSLLALFNSHCIRVPQPIAFGENSNLSFLVLEYLELDSLAGSFSDLAESLATLHLTTSNRGFGWPETNYIGYTSQPNPPCSDWVQFWNKNRLCYQAGLAAKNNCSCNLTELLERVIEITPSLFSNYHPEPSLLHGDLWSGNASFLTTGVPVIYDPACYYGDRETDLAMTELFGGFPREFYQTYDKNFAINPEYRVRKELYQLYHVLNHYNMFAGHYAQQAEMICKKLISETS